MAAARWRQTLDCDCDLAASLLLLSPLFLQTVTSTERLLCPFRLRYTGGVQGLAANAARLYVNSIVFHLGSVRLHAIVLCRCKSNTGFMQ